MNMSHFYCEAGMRMWGEAGRQGEEEVLVQKWYPRWLGDQPPI